MNYATILSLLIGLLTTININSQKQERGRLVQNIYGTVTDKASGHPLPDVTILLTDIQGKGTTTDEKGRFTLPDIPIGRHTVEASFLGYETGIFRYILFIEGLKDYVIIQLPDQRIITKTSLKAIQQLLPSLFLRVNRSYIVNTRQINSFDNNDLFIDKFEIAIGNNYREIFFEEFVARMGKIQ